MEPVGKVMDMDVSCREKLFRCFLRSRCNEGWEEGGSRRFFVSVFQETSGRQVNKYICSGNVYVNECEKVSR